MDYIPVVAYSAFGKPAQFSSLLPHNYRLTLARDKMVGIVIAHIIWCLLFLFVLFMILILLAVVLTRPRVQHWFSFCIFV